MYIFKLLVTLLLIASFGGCDSEDSPWNTSGTDDQDNVCKNIGMLVASCENNVCKDPTGEVISCNTGKEIGPITVTGKTPDGLPGTFFVEIDFCSANPTENPAINVTSFELKMTGFQIQIGRKLCIQLIRDKHLFVAYDWEIKDSDKNATFSFDWNAPNSWGLAPNGVYLNNEGDEREIEAEIEDNKVWLKGFYVSVPLSKNKFEGSENIEGTQLTVKVYGTISDDLKTIEYHEELSTGKKYDGIVTLIK